ncbi:MAG TPA: class I SAM-dependent methyltransferase [Anaerohalosphaeraceae bacterium]|jgi:putative AdoMet-dependent methyltransferase|nr:class I SAM-dependent methyltransferase [Anaerohalosphaeraceae bacterium]HRT50856.1 class I SAM-dependent methyltransferase [Anaerohalosphaeraceae bacterium]HRT86706.1 class I SAM-dependent methyltransferase [Anaerohalosphaeraceae bacterium]
MDTPNWLYDEARHCGVDYGDASLAAAYDVNHSRLRDYDAESRRIIAAVGLKAGETLIDLGCGTGAFAVRAAAHCGRVVGVDVSQAMLDCAAAEARARGIENIEFRRGGFLTYVHEGPPADCIVSTVALHHLPDFWKAVALKRLFGMLRPGGRFYLFDVVFSCDAANFEGAVDGWIRSIAEKSGPVLAAEAEVHLREEYSTFAWVMEGLLERAGFVIESREFPDAFTAAYVCRK